MREYRQYRTWVLEPSGGGWPRRRELPRGRPPGCTVHGVAVDGDHLLSQESLIEIADGGAAGDAAATGQHARQRRRDGLRPIVGAELAARDALEPLGDVAYGDGNDGQIASERFLDGVGRAFLQRSEDECVAGGHVLRHLGVRYPPRDDEASTQRAGQPADGVPREIAALPRVGRISHEQDEALALGQSQTRAGRVLGQWTEQLEVDAGRHDVDGD